MAPPRAQLVKLLETQYNSLSDLGASLSARDWHQPASLPGWDVLDVYAHLIGAESMLTGVELPRPTIDVAALAHVHNDVGIRNEIWVEALSGLDPDEMLARFREVTAKRLYDLRGMTGDEYGSEVDTPDGTFPYWRVLQIRQFDSWMHEQDIREALIRPGNESGRCAEAAVDEAERVLPAIVEASVPADTETAVAIRLTGPVYRTIGLRVRDRAELVRDLPTEPTVQITLSSSLLMRLIGGRVANLAPRLGGLDFGGDLVVAGRIVANLAVTS